VQCGCVRGAADLPIARNHSTPLPGLVEQPCGMPCKAQCCTPATPHSFIASQSGFPAAATPLVLCFSPMQARVIEHNGDAGASPECTYQL
jgi:hypothetical protein